MATCRLPNFYVERGRAAASGSEPKQSKHSVSETVQRFESAVNAKSANGGTVFTEIDHAAAAEKARLKLLPRTVVVFGNPKVGTAGMQKAPDVAMGGIADRAFLAVCASCNDGTTGVARNSRSERSEQCLTRTSGLSWPHGRVGVI
jgi:hypothetical protein